MELYEFCRMHKVRLGPDIRHDIDTRVRKAAYTIIEGKGASYYGIGSVLARIVEVIVNDRRAILTVCSPLTTAGKAGDVTVSLPRLVTGSGIATTFMPAMSNDEEEALKISSGVVRTAIRELDSAAF